MMSRAPHHEVLGCFFLNHPPIRAFRVDVRDSDHPLTRGLPTSFEVMDELYLIELLEPAQNVESFSHVRQFADARGRKGARVYPSRASSRSADPGQSGFQACAARGCSRRWARRADRRNTAHRPLLPSSFLPFLGS